FTYRVAVPGSESGPRQVAGDVDFLISGMLGWGRVSADPNPMTVGIDANYHSADWQAPFWVIDASEAGRVLSYWRADAYHIDASTVDGYAHGLGSHDGPQHDSDFQDDPWNIDSEEVVRVLAYWIAGGYHPDATGPDGFAPGLGSGGSSVLAGSDLAVMSAASGSYTPGKTITITHSIAYTNDLLAMMWKPHLPDGWQIVSVTGEGSPEVSGNEIVWTAKLPPSPIVFSYTCRVPEGYAGDALVYSDAQYMEYGSSTVLSLPAGLAPVVIQRDGDQDGLPDWVETGTHVYVNQFDTGTDPNVADSDGDGVSDGDEVKGRTNPWDRDSMLRITGVIPVRGDTMLGFDEASAPVDIRWSSSSGVTYRVEKSTNLLHGFTAVQTNILATPPENIFMDRDRSGPAAFYRIGVE
ncbi:MAG: thrombospondin type 3 repeat-containing protein, partial [Verrucomicrobia bacterium]|nr:thrombospondin type 3 repeat-containing protein [Verrucomicrobiota bacterium]